MLRAMGGDHFITRRNTFTEKVCDRVTDGGGWIVIQRRLPNGQENFVRKWADYENGFGDLNGEFWYGLKDIHTLTTNNDVELRIDMETKGVDFSFHWTYQTFKVAGASDKYRLTIGGGAGSAGNEDPMAQFNNHQFTTIDSDNDSWDSGNCAYNFQGGFWYHACSLAGLNQPHVTPPGFNGGAVLNWIANGLPTFNLKSVEMKIRIKT